MLRRTHNLGILAHVDAGKTTLTERLLFAAGVIDAPGSVDEGTTQTDTLALERRRGITIRSAVVSFAVDDATVNIIDTPGHPDFIAEVERCLGVLDGAVLVVSAVEGVQVQTRLLLRALRRLHVPTLIFVNKIDRAGADRARVLEAIEERLTPAIVAMGSTHGLGTREAGFTPWGADDAPFCTRLVEVLAEQDDGVLGAFVEHGVVPYPRLREALATQTQRAIVHPVYFGSALTGGGIEPLLSGITELLPEAAHDIDAPLAGRVFKIERGELGEKIAYARLFAGTLRARERVRVGAAEEKVTAMRVFARGPAEQRASASAGEIAMLWGLRGIRIGDRIGAGASPGPAREFAPPAFETVVLPRDPADRGRLRSALAQLAEQDPLIDVRQDGVRRELSVSLYGEVQKEVLEATLAADYGVAVEFRETTTICVERLTGSGAALEVLHAKTKTNVTGKSSPISSNPFPATLGLRVEPGSIGSGIRLRLDVDVRLVPIYIYKHVDTFVDHMTQYVREILQAGLFGWQVTDCTVTITDCGYRAPGTTAADFRKLTPLVLMGALGHAGTVVCEPFFHVSLEVPTGSVGTVLPALARLGGVPGSSTLHGGLATLEALVPAARLQGLRRQLPGLTGGEGVVETSFAGYHPVSGDPPERHRTTPNPLNREEYLLHLARRVDTSA